MQSINHVVVTTLKGVVNSSRIQDLQFESSFQVISALPVRERHEGVETYGLNDRSAVEGHRDCTAWQIVNAYRITE